MRYQLTAIESPCPVCGEAQGRLLYQRTAEQAAQHFVLREKEPARHERLVAAIRRLWQGNEVALVECAGCGFVHAEPHVGGDMEFYTLAYDRTHYPRDKWEFTQSVQAITADPRLREIGLENLRVLEVGAGEGNFLRQLIAAGLRPENLAATDFSEYGRQQIASLGVRVFGKDVRELTPADLPGPAHVICLFQVLEHLDDAVGLFARFAELGTAGVVVLAGVPAPRRMAFNETNGSLLDMPPNHIGRWTPRALEKLAERTGWRLDAVAIEPEGAGAKLSQFAKFGYLRAMQDSGSLANRVERMSGGGAQTLARAGLAAAYTARRLPAALKLASDGTLGNVMWMRLSRG
ncbi:MAG: methyltransferase domain-containing protein [Erythrobacter sp.]|nr:methyltransferase domain-containing protein [Erythrobacter sp.]